MEEAGADREAAFVETDDERPGRHRSETLDLVLVIAGDVHLILEEEPNLREVHLAAGDCVVQRGVWHRWENRSDTPCVLSTVMVTALDQRPEATC
jgi:oxalate decarboxylase/phosphoglucose isomerase-like protein (cupin superfamily)